MLSLTYGNGLNLTRTYDQNYWLNRIQVNTGTSTVLDLSFAPDAAGRLSSVTDNAATGRGASFAYTASDRLSQGIGPWGEEDYAYDAAGNRTGLTTIVGSTTTTETDAIASAANQVTGASVGGTTTRTRSYLTGGDLSSDAYAGGTTYGYDYNARKRLAEVDQGGTSAGTYGYDDRGRRVWRATSGSSPVNSQYIFDEDGHLLAEHDASTGDVLKEYVWVDDTLVAMVDSTGSSPVIYAVHTGQIDEPLVLTDPSQSVAWNGYVKPFGQAQTFSTATASLDLRLPGQWLQTETGGLHQNRYRDYDPSLGRYAEADPLGIEAGQNVYAYVDGNPLNVADLHGLRPITPSDWKWMGGVDIGEEFIGGGPEDPIADIVAGLTDLANIIRIAAEPTPKAHCHGGGSNDPCKGLRNQLAAHRKKLSDYIKDPAGRDNRGLLGQGRDDAVISGRIASLEAQIRNFEKLLEECERQNGMR